MGQLHPRIADLETACFKHEAKLQHSATAVCKENIGACPVCRQAVLSQADLLRLATRARAFRGGAGMGTPAC